MIDHIDYDGFGQVRSETNPAVTHLIGYTGRPFDAETGLQNNHHRWYDANTGRWISKDPIGFAAGDANLSRYVGNGTTNAVDPSGMSLVVTGGFESHTGIEVEVHDADGNVIGILTVDYHGLGFGRDRATGERESCGDVRTVIPVPPTQGRIDLAFRRGDLTPTGIFVDGDNAADERLLLQVLIWVGKDRDWLDEQINSEFGLNTTLNAQSGWGSYNVVFSNCNMFTSDALRVYFDLDTNSWALRNSADDVRRYLRFRLDGNGRLKPHEPRRVPVYVSGPGHVILTSIKNLCHSVWR